MQTKQNLSQPLGVKPTFEYVSTCQENVLTRKYNVLGMQWSQIQQVLGAYRS